MATITRRCDSRGASVIFTIDDVSLRCTQVQITTVNRQMRITLFNANRTIARELTPALSTTTTTPVDVPARLVTITRPSLPNKSYVSPIYAVHF